jgi:hypothetical protein
VGIPGAGQPNVATRNHIPACQRSKRIRIVAFCDRPEGVAGYASACGARAYTHYAAMLANPQLERVHVATPELHRSTSVPDWETSTSGCTVWHAGVPGCCRDGPAVTIELSETVREEERDGDVASTVDAASRRVPDLAGLRTA